MLAPGSDVRMLAVPNPNRCGYPLLQLGSLTLSLRRRHHERSICSLAPVPPLVLTLRSSPVPTLRLPPVPAGRRRSVRRRARHSPPPRRWRPRPLQAPTPDLGTARRNASLSICSPDRHLCSTSIGVASPPLWHYSDAAPSLLHLCPPLHSHTRVPLRVESSDG
jgi:hypothetical protein